MKKILILGAGIYQVPLIKKAKEMGYEKAGDDYFHDVFTTNSGQHSGK